MKAILFATVLVLILGGLAVAQVHQEGAGGRYAVAVRYPQGKETSVSMVGTGLAPSVIGKAEIKRTEGRTRVKLKMEALTTPQSLGPMYTTYILWAIAPEGQADNLAEVPFLKGNVDIDVTTPLQTFSLIITAEPYGTVKLPSPAVLAEYGLEADGYFLTVSRLEPENNADLTLQAFAQVATDKKLVIVGGAKYESGFVRRLRRTTDSRVTFLAPEYRPDRLRELYCGAFAYVHGNEVGGTNPALLQAMGHGSCVLALDVPFNAEVVADAALLYRKDPADLAAKLQLVLEDAGLVRRLRERARERVKEAYRWDEVIAAYESLLRGVVAGGEYGRGTTGDTISVP